MKDYTYIYALLLTMMFFFSGLSKISNFTSVSDSFRDKFNVNSKISELIITIVILIEIIAPIIIVYYYYYNTNSIKKYAKISILTLICFTILTTLLYKQFDFTSYYKSTAFLANLSLVGGLLLLYNS